jgi:hypothetical protein
MNIKDCRENLNIRIDSLVIISLNTTRTATTTIIIIIIITTSTTTAETS